MKVNTIRPLRGLWPVLYILLGIIVPLYFVALVVGVMVHFRSFAESYGPLVALSYGIFR